MSGRDLATDSRAPLRCALLERSLPAWELSHRGDPTLTTTAGEREDRRMRSRALPPPSSATCSPRGGLLAEVRGPNPTEKHPTEAPSDQDPEILPSPCHERDRLRRAGEDALPLPPSPPRVAERRGQRARSEHQQHLSMLAMPPLLEAPPRRRMGGRPFASVIAATPRALNPMFHQPRRPRALRDFRERLCPSPRGETFGWAYREIWIVRPCTTGDSGSLPALESKPSRDG